MINGYDERTMKMKRATATTRLTDQQRYLLQRIPSSYQMNGYKDTPMPAAVKKAEATVSRWHKEQSRQKCQAEKRGQALRTKAREAVYFSSPEKALAIIRQCEKMLKGCE